MTTLSHVRLRVERNSGKENRTAITQSHVEAENGSIPVVEGLVCTSNFSELQGCDQIGE